MKLKELIRHSVLYRRFVKPILHRKEFEWKKKRNSLFKKEAVLVLQSFAKALNSEKIEFWPAFGTLLGIYRDGDFIPFDIDIDVAAYLYDRERIHNALLKEGFSLIRYYKVNLDGGYEECYKHKDFTTTIDVFYFQEDKERIFCYTFSPEEDMNKKENLNKECKFSCRKYSVPKDNLKQTIFKGVNIYMPVHAELQLGAIYGSNFMTPDPNFEHHENENIKFYKYHERPAIGFLKSGYWDL